MEPFQTEITYPEEESKLDLAQFLAKMGDFTWEIKTGNVIFSKGLYRLLKYDVNETINIEFIQNKVYHPKDNQLIKVYLKEHFENKRTKLAPSQFRLLCKDGEAVHVTVRGWIKYNDKNEPYELFGIFQDISERIKQEEALVNSKNRWKSLAEDSPDYIMTLDKKLRVLFINKTVGNMVKEDVIGMYLPDLTMGEKEQVEEILLKVLASGVGANYETHQTTPDGIKHFFETRVQLLDGSEEKARLLLTSTDITERKLTELKMIEAKEKAEDANKAKSNFLANMSHELRTPMNIVLGMADILLETQVDQDQKDFIQRIKKNGQSLMHIIGDLLVMAKMEAGKIKILHEAFLIDSIIKEVVQLFSDQIERKNIELSYSIHPDCGDENRFGDPLRLKQILINLLSNAIKFTHNGSIKLEIVPEANNINNLLFYITDTGIGIEEKHLDLIFDTFEQVDELDTRNQGGTGLGLSIVKNLVQLMGGMVSVTSVVKQGTTFTVKLPLPEIAKKEAFEENIKNAEALLEKDIRILIVEDDEDSRFLVERYAKKITQSIDSVSNGEDALEKVKKYTYDLILMDIRMPGINGYEATQKIRAMEHLSQPKIVALTAHALEEDILRCKEAGMDDHLSKPVYLENLKAKIKQYFY